jgi:hypothetical protein
MGEPMTWCHANRTEDVRNVAVGYGIELLFIHSGMTDRLQPLDRYVFGALKSVCRRLFDLYCADNPTIRIDKPTALQFLREAWDRITVEILQRAWGVYTDIPEDDDEEWEEIGE